jgi:hypothetical protein
MHHYVLKEGNDRTENVRKSAWQMMYMYEEEGLPFRFTLLKLPPSFAFNHTIALEIYVAHQGPL